MLDDPENQPRGPGEPPSDEPPAPPTTNAAVAVDFLERCYCAGGPWVLCAIQPENGAVRTATFRDPDATLAWIVSLNAAGWNIYFHVNPTFEDMNKKAAKKDIAAVEWLQVDIDPRAREKLEEEQPRIAALLTTKLPPNIPPPTVIIFSGGGYQAFWKLAEPIVLDGSEEAADRAALYNRQLALDLEGDLACQDVSHVMRVPGTVNWPSEKKRAKGRVRALAELVEFHPERVYSLDRFTAARLSTQPGLASGTPASAAFVPGPRVRDLAELDQYGVADRVKAIVVQGHHRDVEGPKQPDDSRSEWLFDAVCQLVRANVPDEVIYAVITDPDFGISESVLDKGSRTDAYARRQIARARGKVEQDARNDELLRLAGAGLTDTGNAERFARDHAELVRYVRGFKSWIAWDGRRWDFDQDALAPLRLAKATAREMERGAAAIDDEDARKRAYRWALDSHQAPRRRAMVDLAKPALAVEPRDLDADPMLLNVANGILDLRTYELREHDPAALQTKIAPAAYRPGARCEVFDAAVARVLPDPEVRACFQRAVGYALQGGQQAKQVFFMIGKKDSGKSTMIDAVTRALGFDKGGVGAVCRSYVAVSDVKAFAGVAGNRPELAYLFGARVVVIHEITKGKELETGTFKAWSGGDLVSATPKYGHPISFHPDGTLFFLGNEMARLDFADDAAWERVVVIPFPVQIPEAERDRGLRDRFDLDGVLAWCVEGHRQYRERGIDAPSECRVAREKQRAKADPLHGFWERETEPHEAGRIGSAELFGAYGRWADAERELDRDRLTRRAFTEQAKHGAEARSYRWDGRGWCGVRLRVHLPDQDDVI